METVLTPVVVAICVTAFVLGLLWVLRRLAGYLPEGFNSPRTNLMVFYLLYCVGISVILVDEFKKADGFSLSLLQRFGWLLLISVIVLRRAKKGFLSGRGTGVGR